MPLRNANSNMKSLFMGGMGMWWLLRGATVILKWWLSPRSREQSAELNRCFDCAQDNEVLLRPTGYESLVALLELLEMLHHVPGAAGGTLGPV